MLKTFLTSQPYTKFVIIQDSIENRGKPIFDYLLKNHLERTQHKIQYFVFHGSFKRVRSSFTDNPRVVLYNFTQTCGWSSDPSETESFESVVARLGCEDVVIIDSLAHMNFQYGLGKSYKYLNNLKSQANVQQIIGLLHVDLLPERDKVVPLFAHLCTLSLSVEPKFISDNCRVHYTHKKRGGKVVKELEEYRFESGNLITEKIKTPDIKKLLEKPEVPDINPETLSTFRIGLNEKEKESRDQLVLPYLPKNDTKSDQEGGRIFYELDDVDDWDEEDPDDDLDI